MDNTERLKTVHNINGVVTNALIKYMICLFIYCQIEEPFDYLKREVMHCTVHHLGFVMFTHPKTAGLTNCKHAIIKVYIPVSGNQCWYNVGPLSTTLAQHCTNTG